MTNPNLPSSYVDILHPPAAVTPTQSIAEIASGNENFEILVAALDAAGLVPTFLNPGDFTVFAPTDDAFRKLAEETLGLDLTGLSDADVAGDIVDAVGLPTLTQVLQYHVRAGAASVSELASAGTVPTLLTGASFTVNGNALVDNDPDVENPEYISGLTDIAATNGTIHAIDRVLLPIDLAEADAGSTIAEVAASLDSFEALVAALTATGLDTVVADRDADFTVFAPTDDAFRALAEALGIDTTGVSDADLAPALVGALGADLVTDTLLYHVAPGSMTTAELRDARIVETAFDGELLGIKGNRVFDSDPDNLWSKFVPGLTDIETVNGTIQVIDSVLLPIDVAPSDGVDYVGTDDRDIFIGGAGDDMLSGRKRADVLIGGDGNDVIKGHTGRDTLIGGDGNDMVSGGAGKDILVEGAGTDSYRGKGGADLFDFRNMENNNVIRDFTAGEDTLLLSLDDFATATEVVNSARLKDNGLYLRTSEGNVILNGVETLGVDDILLA